MGQHLGKREAHPETESKAPSPEVETEPEPEPEMTQNTAEPAEPETQDEVFGLGGSETDVNQNNGCPSEKPAVTDSTGAEGPHDSWPDASTADADAATPRPHLVRLFSRDAPGREDNTFKDRPSESDELQTIQEHGGAGSECGSEDQDLD